jgi:hypothetical protein
MLLLTPVFFKYLSNFLTISTSFSQDVKFPKKLKEFTCSIILLFTSNWILCFKCNQPLFCAAIIKPRFVIILFGLYAALVRTEDASFTPQSISDSEKPYFGEETSQDTIEHIRHKSYSTNI